MTEGLLEPAGGVLGDVLIERARQGACREDALDGGVVARAERRSVTERAIDLVGGIALAQEQDLARLRAPDPRRAQAHQSEELGGVLAHVAKGDLELVEIDGAAPLRRGVQPGRVEPEARAARPELVARDALEVGGVHEQLALRDAHGQDVRDVVIGDGVVIAGPRDEAVDAAHAIDHARGVIRMSWERDQVLALLGEALERGALFELAVVDDVIEPVRELRAHVVEVAKLAAVEERALDFPERPLRPGFVVGVTAPNGQRPKFIVAREREKPRIVDRLIALPAQHDRLLAVVLALVRAAAEARERALGPIHQRVQVIGLVEPEVLPLAHDQHVRQGLDHTGLAGGELDLVGRPVALRHLARPVVGRGQAWGRLRRRAHRPHVPLHAGVATVEALGAQDLEHALRGDVGELRHQRCDPRSPPVELRGARRAGRAWRDRGVLGVAVLRVGREQRAHGVAAHAEGAGDRAARLALLGK